MEKSSCFYNFHLYWYKVRILIKKCHKLFFKSYLCFKVHKLYCQRSIIQMRNSSLEVCEILFLYSDIQRYTKEKSYDFITLYNSWQSHVHTLNHSCSFLKILTGYMFNYPCIFCKCFAFLHADCGILGAVNTNHQQSTRWKVILIEIIDDYVFFVCLLLI